MSYRLGINTGFAVNRFSEPEEWTRICGEEIGIKYIQFTADMLNPDLPDRIVKSNIDRIIKSCQKYVTSRSKVTHKYIKSKSKVR